MLMIEHVERILTVYSRQHFVVVAAQHRAYELVCARIVLGHQDTCHRCLLLPSLRANHIRPQKDKQKINEPRPRNPQKPSGPAIEFANKESE